MIKHFTATAYIIAKKKGEASVLLHHHKKLGLWLGIGGHIEKDENPLEAVLREVEEETQLPIEVIISDQNRLITTGTVNEMVLPEAILEEKIPKYGQVSAHCHIDCIYFAITRNPEKIQMKEHYIWATEKKMNSLNVPKEVLILAKKALIICQKYL